MAQRLRDQMLVIPHRRPLLVALLLAALSTPASARPVFDNLEPTLAEQQRLVAADPDDAELWNDLGNLLLLDRRARDAETAYRMATSLDAHNTSALYNLALLLRNRGDLVEAEAHLSTLLALHEGHARAHYQRGAIYEAQHNRNAAIREYATAFELDPELVFPRVNPDVIGNGLMLESLLKREKKGVRAASLATLYEESGRIVLLLVPPIEASREERKTVEKAERRGISAKDLEEDGSLNRLEEARNQQDRPQPRARQDLGRLDSSFVDRLNAGERTPPRRTPPPRR